MHQLKLTRKESFIIMNNVEKGGEAMGISDVLANMKSYHVENADVLDGLAMIPDNTIQCVVTSPP